MYVNYAGKEAIFTISPLMAPHIIEEYEDIDDQVLVKCFEGDSRTAPLDWFGLP